VKANLARRSAFRMIALNGLEARLRSFLFFFPSPLRRPPFSLFSPSPPKKGFRLTTGSSFGRCRSDIFSVFFFPSRRISELISIFSYSFFFSPPLLENGLRAEARPLYTSCSNCTPMIARRSSLLFSAKTVDAGEISFPFFSFFSLYQARLRALYSRQIPFFIPDLRSLPFPLFSPPFFLW